MTDTEKFLQTQPDKLIVAQLSDESVETFISKVEDYLTMGWRWEEFNYFSEKESPNLTLRYYSILLRARNFNTQEV